MKMLNMKMLNMKMLDMKMIKKRLTTAKEVTQTTPTINNFGNRMSNFGFRKKNPEK